MRWGGGICERSLTKKCPLLLLIDAIVIVPMIQI